MGNNYPTVLVVGQRQYLGLIEKELKEKYPQLTYKLRDDSFSIIDGYKLLLYNEESNLGWRILIHFYLPQKTIKSVIEQTVESVPIIELLEQEFINVQHRILEIIKEISEGNENKKMVRELKGHLGENFRSVMDFFSPSKEDEQDEVDSTKPSILLTSFVGCKGLSAGHVITVGANNGSLPRNPKDIQDIEIAQFMVALTRTRKQCHIVSNQWLIAPKLGKVWQEECEPTLFLDWIPKRCIENRGYLKSSSIKID